MNPPAAPEVPATTAPASLQALAQLVDRLAQGTGDVQLGRKAMTALAQALAAPADFALLSITQAAARHGISASTWTRLATRLGYEGFADFQAVFQAHLAQQTPYFYARQTRQAVDLQQPGGTAAAVLAAMAQSAIDNIHALGSEGHAQQIEQVAQQLATAPRVACFGLRQMHSVASYLSYGLGLLRPDVCVLGGSNMAVAEGLAQLVAGDVLVVTSVAPYTRMVVDVARAAREQGLVVVALTDHRASPLAAAAQHAIYVSHASAFVSNSLVAHLVVCEALVNTAAQLLGDSALAAVQQRERWIARLGIEQ